MEREENGEIEKGGRLIRMEGINRERMERRFKAGKEGETGWQEGDGWR